MNVKEDVLNENTEEIEEVELQFEDLIILATGMGENDVPNSTALLTIEELTDKESLSKIKEVIIDEGSFAYAINGGCAVVEIIFKKQNTFQYKKTCDICETWIENSNNKEYENKIISLTVMPTIVKGEIVISFENLVYYLGIRDKDENRIIMCFDNNLTNIFETGLDYQNIKKQVELEDLNEERELDEKIFQTEEEIKKLEDEIFYEEHIANMLENEPEKKEKTDASYHQKYGMRVSDETEESEE